MSGASDFSPHVDGQSPLSPMNTTRRSKKTVRKPTMLPAWQNLVENHKQAFRLSWDRLKHSPLATTMTMIVIAIALALPTSFFSAAGYLQSIAGTWHRHVQISLYLDVNLPQEQQHALLTEINGLPQVANVTLITPDEGLKLFQEQSEFADIIQQLPKNPLPPVIEITPVKQMSQSHQLDQLMKTLQSMPGVDVAQLDKEWVERLHSIIHLFDRFSMLLGMALAIAVLLTIGNTMRLILKKYQSEIELMNLLGAKKRYIRRPYLYMGMLYGVGGAFCAWILLTIALILLKAPLQSLASVYHLPLGFALVPIDILPSLLFIGGMLGTTGAWLTVNKDVQTH